MTDKHEFGKKDLFKDTKDILDTISPSMCLAKWNQVTLHLGTGTNHSCHHPAVHQTPLVELKRNPSALHNTDYKKQIREKMLNGERPDECDYCWRAEDSAKSAGIDNTFSDRITKSSESWSLPYIEKIKQIGSTGNINPTYVEVDFDATCNFKCAYCMPTYSTTWQQEIKQYGPYKLTQSTLHDLEWLKNNKMLPILAREENPYIDAFWEWWPSLVKDLKVFRITGGEPLLSKNTFKVLDYLIENPQPELEFNINSNLGATDDIIDSFIEKMKIIQKNKCVKMFKLYTSNEAHGKQSEYIRFGINYDKWKNNCHRILSEIPDSYLTVMAAFNVLSLTTFKKMMDDIIEMKHMYTKQPIRKHPVSLDIAYVRWPEHLSAWILPDKYLKYVEDIVTHIYKNLQQTHWPPMSGKGFFDYEVNRAERLYYVIKETMHEMDIDKKMLLRKQFAEYIIEYDKRRGTNFLETFPEYEEFFNHCKNLTVENENTSLFRIIDHRVGLEAGADQ